MQNHWFDNLFGTFPGADGIRPGEAGYTQQDSQGASVSPHLLTEVATPDLPHGRDEYLRTWNSGGMDQYAFYNGVLSLGYYDKTTPGMDRLWSWASQYAVADHFFASVMSSAPSNQLFMMAASDNNFPHSVQPFYGPCNNGGTTEAPYTFANLGDQLSGAGITWAWYQENLWQCNQDYIAPQNPFQYFTSTHKSPNLQDYANFDRALDSGTLPAVAFVQPAPDHSMHPGSGSMTNGLLWLDQFLIS
jgi:phospholipase C